MFKSAFRISNVFSYTVICRGTAIFCRMLLPIPFPFGFIWFERTANHPHYAGYSNYRTCQKITGLMRDPLSIASRKGDAGAS